MDFSLPDRSGIELTLQLRKSLPKTFIVMVTMHSKVGITDIGLWTE